MEGRESWKIKMKGQKTLKIIHVFSLTENFFKNEDKKRQKDDQKKLKKNNNNNVNPK